MRHDLVQQFGTVAVRTGRQARDWAFQPVHLSILAQIQGAPSGHRVDPSQRLALGLLMRAQRTWRRSGQRVVAGSFGTRSNMDPFQAIDLGLQSRRQRVVGRRPVGEQGLALAFRDRTDRQEQRDIRRWAAIALIRMPAPTMGKSDGKAAIVCQRRVRRARRLAVHRGDVGDDENLRHRVVHHIGRCQRVPVVFDFGPEDATEANQQFRFGRHAVLPGQQQQPAAGGQHRGQSLGRAFRCFNKARGGGPGKCHASTEMRTGQRLREFEAIAHGASPGSV